MGSNLLAGKGVADLGRRSRWRWWLAGALLVLYLGARWAIATFYPFEYRPTIYQNAAQHRLDPYLVAAMVRVESGWDPGATSRRGARGLMQVMPETGRWIAGQTGLRSFDPDMLYNANFNLSQGCWYIASLRQEFGGAVVPALAAYNGGSQNVRLWLQQRKWDGQHTTVQQIPFPETRDYVTRVLTDQARYRRFYDRGSLLARVLWPVDSLHDTVAAPG